MYTYFIISPGYDASSYVQYPDGKKGNYIKFGDAQHEHDQAGVRGAYLTHNPDIGVAAVMDSTAFSNPYLGTQLKNYITGLGIRPVGTSEWFSIETAAAWNLFNAMLAWDGKTLRPGDLQALQAIIRKYLT